MDLKYFDRLERMPNKGKNKLYVGYKSGKKFLIKRYVIRKGRETVDRRRIMSEMLCYMKVRGINTLKVVDANPRAELLIFEFRKLRSIAVNKEGVDKALRLYERMIKGRKAAFLTKVDFDYYTGSLSAMAKRLQKWGLVKDANGIMRLFIDNRRLIEKAPRCFSHGDFWMNNLRLDGKRLIMLDFEYSEQDNQMYDLASLYLNLYDKESLRDYFYKKICRRSFFDKRLFDLMVYRRSIEMAHALRKTSMKDQVKSAVEILNEGRG